MLQEFHDKGGIAQHDDFQAWRRANASAYFLAVASSKSAKLHGSRCQHLGNATWGAREYGNSLTHSRKVVAASESELMEWTNDRRISVTSCLHCVRDGLLKQSANIRRQKSEIPDGISSRHILTALADLDGHAPNDSVSPPATTCFTKGADIRQKR
jgi:hypothetical protein